MATTAVLYLLNNTADDPSSRIVITPGAYDGPGGVQRSTDLTFYGNGAPNWGERFNENFYHLLENFAVAEKGGLDGIPNPDTAQVPTPKDEDDLGGIGLGVNSPIEGQTWYNRSRGLMYLYTGVESGGVGDPRWKPLSNLLVLDDAATRDAYFDGTERDGEIVYNRDTLSIEVFDQGSWTSTSNFIRLDGSNTPMTGALSLYGGHLSYTGDAHAASQGYVNAAISGGTGSLSLGSLTDVISTVTSGSSIGQYLRRSSSTSGQQWQASGLLWSDIQSTNGITTNTTQINYLNTTSSNVQTQLNGKLSLTGGTMSGQINMGLQRIVNMADPINAQDAATKDYVDTLIGGAGMLSVFGASGYIDIPVTVSGTPRTLIVQWGQTNTTGISEPGWPATATFPKPFPNQCFQVIAGARGYSPGYTRQAHHICVRNETITTTGFTCEATEDDSKNQDFAMSYIAIGW